jgi:hypothetical protein
MGSTKFELKAGFTIRCHTQGGVDVTNENLTDELALAVLREKPFQRKNFTKLPENIDELLKQTEVKEPASKKVPEEKQDASEKPESKDKTEKPGKNK